MGRGATRAVAPAKILGGPLQVLFLHFGGAMKSYFDKITTDLGKNVINFSLKKISIVG